MNDRLLRLFVGWFMMGVGIFMIIMILSPQSIWGIVWMFCSLLMLPVITWGSDQVWGMRVLVWLLPHHHVVRTMDLDGEVRHALARGEWGQVLHAHRFWLAELGGMHLHPNGLVTGISYVYFWEPLDQDALSQMHLSYACMDWHKLQRANWRELEEYRHQLRGQIKLMS